jgi:hypothetical protein
MDEAAKHHLNQFVQVCINPTLCPEDWRRLYRDYLVKQGWSLQKALYDHEKSSFT